MSRAMASARQRRAGIEPAAPQITQQQQPTPPSGLTLQQVIALVDNRLIVLEQFMKTSQNSNSSVIEIRDSNNINVSDSSDPNQLTDLNEILEEYNNRFVLLAEEIGQIKDTVMKLQTYTMDVNKMLIEERVNVLSDFGNDNTSMFVMNNTTLEDIQNIEDKQEVDHIQFTGEDIVT